MTIYYALITQYGEIMTYLLTVVNGGGARPAGEYSTVEQAQQAFDGFLYDFDEDDLLFDSRQYTISIKTPI